MTLFISLVPICTDAQQVYNGQITLQNVTCEQQGDRLFLRMHIDAADADIPSREALVLTPVVRTDSVRRDFPPVVISGKNRYKADKRVKEFGGKTAYPSPYITMKSGSHDTAVIKYERSIPFEPWMIASRMEIEEVKIACAGCTDTLAATPLPPVRFEKRIPDEPEKPQGKPSLSYISPQVEAVKNRNMEGQAYLDFPAGKWAIISDFRNNFAELVKMQEIFNQVHKNPDAVINSVVLKGFASPEGKYATNEHLSKQRTLALKRFLQDSYGFVDNIFTLSSVAEDWAGLESLVAASDLADRQEILDIINSSGDYDVKERKLKSLNGGNTFKKLLDGYFPQLRHVDYRLNFTIRAFSVDEGKEIVKVRPANLSLNEMFLVANTYPKGSDEFNQVFDIAVRMFPADTVANINAAAIELGKGHAADAHRYLDPFADVPASWNNRGVMFLLEGDYGQARIFFTKAQEHGSPEAAGNLLLLELWEAYQTKKDAYEAARKNDRACPHIRYGRNWQEQKRTNRNPLPKSRSQHHVRTLILLLLFGSLPLAVSAWEKTSELNAGYGMFASTRAIERSACYSATGLSKGMVSANPACTGTFHVGYKYRDEFSQYIPVAVGATFLYDRVWSGALAGNDAAGQFNDDFYTFIGEMNIVYFNRRKLQLYGVMGAGFTYCMRKFTSNENECDVTRIIHLNFQLSPIGIKYGETAGVFAELGLGSKGMICAGLFVRF